MSSSSFENLPDFWLPNVNTRPGESANDRWEVRIAQQQLRDQNLSLPELVGQIEWMVDEDPRIDEESDAAFAITQDWRSVSWDDRAAAYDLYRELMARSHRLKIDLAAARRLYYEYSEDQRAQHRIRTAAERAGFVVREPELSDEEEDEEVPEEEEKEEEQTVEGSEQREGTDASKEGSSKGAGECSGEEKKEDEESVEG